MFRIPKQEIRSARVRKGWTQEDLAEQMTLVRHREVGNDEFSFSFSQVSRLEVGRGLVLFDSDREPLWWAMMALDLVPALVVTTPRQGPPQRAHLRQGGE